MINIKTKLHLGSLHLSLIVLAAFSFLSLNEHAIEAGKHHGTDQPVIVAVSREKEPIRFNMGIELPYRQPGISGS